MNDPQTSHHHTTGDGPAAPTAEPGRGKHHWVWLGSVLTVALLASVGCAAGSDTSAPDETARRAPADFARTFEIGDGRTMYMQCSGQGSPRVILVSGGGIAGDVWDSPLGEHPAVEPTVAEHTRVCSYDRPGTTRALAEGGISRSDPVGQPITTADSTADLDALLRASGESGPFVLAAHSYGGLVARLYANEHPDQVAGLVLIDSFSPELRDAMGDDWPAWLVANTPSPAILADYPDYEQVAFDEALDQVEAHATLEPMPTVVLTADAPYPAFTIPGVRPDLNVVIRTAQDTSQRRVAQLVPGAEHVTELHSAHDIMLDKPALVSASILEVVDAVRDGRTTVEGAQLPTATTGALDAPSDAGSARSGTASATLGG
jgi:pimeloyl-ACP methyl ester carboxylesterase